MVRNSTSEYEVDADSYVEVSAVVDELEELNDSEAFSHIK